MNNLLEKKLSDLKAMLAKMYFESPTNKDIFVEYPHALFTSFCSGVASKIDGLADGSEVTRLILVRNYFFLKLVHTLLREDISYDFKPNNPKMTSELRSLVQSMTDLKDHVLHHNILSDQDILNSEQFDDLLKNTMLAEPDLHKIFQDVQVGW